MAQDKQDEALPRRVYPSESSLDGLSEETLKWIDLWYTDRSWALEKFGGNEKKIIGELLAALGIVTSRPKSVSDADDEED